MHPSSLLHDLLGNLPANTTLADAAAKSAILLLLAVLLSPCLRQASASARHVLWFSALACTLLIPFFTLGLPQWHVSWLPHWNQTPAAIAFPDQFQSSIHTAPKNNSSIAGDISAPPAPEFLLAPVVASTRASTFGGLFVRGAGIVWIMGALLALLPTLAGWLQVARLTRRGRSLDTPAWKSLLAETTRQMNVRLPVLLIATPDISLPFTWGALRPAVIFPEAAATWPEARCRLVLLHELGHIKRRDRLTQTLGGFACALYWFNPLAWLAVRHLRLEREQACDDLVLRCGQPPKDYARELLELAALSSPHRLLNLTAIPMARCSTLESRLRAILDPKRPRAPLSRPLTLSGCSLALAISAPFAMLHAAPAQPPQPFPALAADIPWSAALGSPKIPNPKTPGFFIWHAGKGGSEVYLTAEVNNKLKKNQVLAGTITVTLGKITGLTHSKISSSDFVTLVNPTKISFNLAAGNGRHSFHFKLTGGTFLTFKATNDGASAGNIVYYGPKATNAKGSPSPITFALTQ